MGYDVTDRAHTRLLRHVLQLGVLVALCLPQAARGDIDPGGLWSVTVDVSFFGNPVSVAVTFQRSGNTLDAHVQNLGNSPFSRFPSHLAGSIDPVSGAFTATGDSACFGVVGAAPQTISGTFGPAGDVLAGTADLDFTFGTPLKCFRAVGDASGTRTSVTCGNGLPDTGEACEFDPAVPGCCTLDCQPRPASPCTPADALCSSLGLCSGCGSGVCDGAGACARNPRPAGILCRAATNECDIAETCDGSSTECPADQTVPPPDSDGDGMNDGCDPCTGGAPASKPRLKASRLTGAALDDRLTVRGTLDLPDLAAIDPVANGLRLVVDDSAGLRYVDATAPGGAGWKVTGSGWSFRSDAGVTSIKLKRAKSTPGALVVSLRGKGAWRTGPPPETSLPLGASVVLDPPVATTGLCGELTFPGPPRVLPSCALQRDGSSVNCR